jgi:hypothetical protein
MLWDSTDCYGDTFTFCMYMIFVSHKKHAYEISRPVTGTALLFVCRWCSYLTGNAPMSLYSLLQGQLFFFYVEDVGTSQKTCLWAPPPVTETALFTACKWRSYLTGDIRIVHNGHLTGIALPPYRPPRPATRRAQLASLAYRTISI